MKDTLTVSSWKYEEEGLLNIKVKNEALDPYFTRSSNTSSTSFSVVGSFL